MRWRGRVKRELLSFIQGPHQYRVEQAARALGLDAELVTRCAYALRGVRDQQVAVVAEQLARVKYEAARELRRALEGTSDEARE